MAPTPPQSRQRATPADPHRLPGKGLGHQATKHTFLGKPRRPHTRPRSNPPYFPNSRTPEIVFRKQSYLHDDSGTAIPSKTPDSPAPGGETKDTQSTPQAPLCTGGGGGNQAKLEPRRKSLSGRQPPNHETPMRGSLWPRQPRKPSHLHSSAASRPHCRDPTEFPVSDNDAISVREETHNKPGGRRGAGCPSRGPLGPAERLGAPEGRAAPRPSRSRPGPEGPRVGAARGQAGRRAAGRSDPPHSRCSRPVPRRRPDKCKRDPRLPGRGDRQRTEGPGGSTAPRAGPGPPARPGAAKPVSVRPPGWGATRTRQLHGGGGSREAEAPNPGARRDHRAIVPCSSARPGDSRKDPLTRPQKPQKMPLPSAEASSDPGTSRVPSPTPPQNQ